MERQIVEQGHQKKEQQIIKPQKQNVQLKKEEKSKNVETAKTEENKTSKPQEKKPEKIQIKKQFAVVYGKDLPLSYKTAGAVCRFIKNKNPQKSIELLELVEKKMVSIPIRGEAAHKKTLKKGYSGGKYPEKTAKYFIKMLKNLIANAKINNLDTENIIVTIAKADKASNPIRGTRLGFGRKKFKRAHVFIKAQEKINKTETTKNTKS